MYASAKFTVAQRRREMFAEKTDSIFYPRVSFLNEFFGRLSILEILKNRKTPAKIPCEGFPVFEIDFTQRLSS